MACTPHAIPGSKRLSINSFGKVFFSPSCYFCILSIFLTVMFFFLSFHSLSSLPMAKPFFLSFPFPPFLPFLLLFSLPNQTSTFSLLFPIPYFPPLHICLTTFTLLSPLPSPPTPHLYTSILLNELLSLKGMKRWRKWGEFLARNSNMGSVWLSSVRAKVVLSRMRKSWIRSSCKGRQPSGGHSFSRPSFSDSTSSSELYRMRPGSSSSAPSAWLHWMRCIKEKKKL